MKKVAIDYKGKYFILCDEDMVDDMDYVIPYINVDIIISNDFYLQNHIDDCFYYGIPSYIGKDEELKKRIKRIEKRQ